MKVSLFDKKVLKTFLASLGLVETVLSIILIFVDVPQDTKIRSILALILLAAFVLDYVILIIAANTKKKASTTINSIQVKICVGDIFKQTGCLKVIPFNERFDTLVDNVIISEKSLNGQYITKYLNETPEELKQQITNNPRLASLITLIDSPGHGEAVFTYPLGTIVKNGEYLLLAFSKVNANNEAFHDNRSLWNSLVNMWKEIGIAYAGESVCLPLLGSGITRFVDNNISEQELLELMLYSLKVSGLQLNWNCGISVIIHPNNAKSIDFYGINNFLCD